MSDEEAIDKAKRGDRDAFRALVQRHSRAVFRLGYRMTNSETDAEDLVQETFLRAWKQIGKFDGRAAFGSWLHRICGNCALDLLRARKRRPEVRPVLREDDSDSMARVATSTPDPERLTASARVTAALVPALARLSEMERVAFIMRHHEGHGLDEISRALNIKQGAVKNTIFRAVQKLRTALEPLRGTV